jgi:hypothetical protein
MLTARPPHETLTHQPPPPSAPAAVAGCQSYDEITFIVTTCMYTASDNISIGNLSYEGLCLPSSLHTFDDAFMHMPLS